MLTQLNKHITLIQLVLKKTNHKKAYKESRIHYG
jgi:hypothetical protein